MCLSSSMGSESGSVRVGERVERLVMSDRDLRILRVGQKILRGDEKRIGCRCCLVWCAVWCSALLLCWCYWRLRGAGATVECGVC